MYTFPTEGILKIAVITSNVSVFLENYMYTEKKKFEKLLVFW